MTNIHGARWWKVDFHTHTPESEDTPWHDLEGDEALTTEQWLLKYMAAGVDCVAVTDHNSGAWIDRLKETYERMRDEEAEGFRPLLLFPGVELSVNGGFHIIALLDTTKSRSDIDSLLGRVGFNGTKGSAEDCTTKSVKEVVEEILAAGGIAIPAHVDDAKGLLQPREDEPTRWAKDPLTVRQVLDEPHVLAMEVRSHEFKIADHVEGRGNRWAAVAGSDCHSFRGDGVTPGERFTWVKMEEPNLEQLRLALLDGDNLSVKRSDEYDGDPNDIEHNFIDSLTITNASVMGRGDPAAFRFSPWMSALVGGRGTGKSTAVHFIRASLDKAGELDAFPETSLPSKTYTEFMSVSKGRNGPGGLQDQTEAVLLLNHEGRRFRITWKTSGGHRVEEEKEGQWQESASQDLTRFKTRIHSQGQIIEMSTGKAKSLLDLVDERVGAKETLDAIVDAENRFLTARAKWRELRQRLEGQESVTAELEDVKHKLKRFEESDHAEVLRNHGMRASQMREVARQRGEVETFAQDLKELADQQVLSALPEGLLGEGDRQALTATEELEKAVQTAQQDMETLVAALTSAVEQHRKQTDDGPLGEEASKAAKAYQDLVGVLEEEGVSDPSQYDVLVKRRQTLDEKLQALKDISAESDEVHAVSVQVLDELRQLRQDLTRKRSDFLERVLKDNQHVRITVEFMGPSDVESAFSELCGVFGWGGQAYLDELWTRDEEGGKDSGALPDLYRALPTDNSGLQELDQRLHSLKENLVKSGFGMSEHFKKTMRNSLERVFGDRPETVDRLWLWFPEDTISVEYSQSGDGRNFKPISSGSPGQRSAALLAFLLSYGEDPIVLDQPEDDLDNHLIYDLVVKQIRECKTSRQIIVVTHNPNIVVNGDAEQVLAMDYIAGQCKVSQSGGLQNQSIRREVCRVMEGGAEAFERRYRRLSEGG